MTVGDCTFDHPRGPRALLRKTKNGKPRVVPLTADLVKIIQRLINADGLTDPDQTVFGYSGRWSVNQAIERVCATAGIKYYSSHKLGRHAFAARLLDEGHSLKHVQEAGDWSSIQIVADNYGHLEANSTDAAILEVAEDVSKQVFDTQLTHARNSRRRGAKAVSKTPIISKGKMVGTTGIEPVTPTMSR